MLLATQLARCAPDRALCLCVAALMMAHCNFLLAGILAGTLEALLPVLFVFDGVDVGDGAVSAAGADADGADEAKDDGLVGNMEDGNGDGNDIFADIEGLTKKV
eukprot:6190844-Pleurochrysis_carterae.AAC.1